MKGYFINLERSKERLRSFLSQDSLKGISLVRVPAVDGSKLSKKDSRFSLALKHRLKTGERRSHLEIGVINAAACSLSHISVWRMLLASNDEFCVVFEDDAKVDPRLISELSKLSWNDFDILILVPPRKVEKDNGRLLKVKEFSFAGGYILKRKAAERLLSHALPVDLHLDAFIWIVSDLEGLSIRATPFPLVTDPLTESEIQHDDCAICNVETNFSERYFMVSKGKMVTLVLVMVSIFIILSVVLVVSIS